MKTLHRLSLGLIASAIVAVTLVAVFGAGTSAPLPGSTTPVTGAAGVYNSSGNLTATQFIANGTASGPAQHGVFGLDTNYDLLKLPLADAYADYFQLHVQPFANSGTTGTASSAGNTTLVDSSYDSGKTKPASYYDNYFITITGGTGNGQTRTVTNYTNTSGTNATWTVNPAWTTTPDATSHYSVALNNTVADFGFNITSNNGYDQYTHSWFHQRERSWQNGSYVQAEDHLDLVLPTEGQAAYRRPVFYTASLLTGSATNASGLDGINYANSAPLNGSTPASGGNALATYDYYFTTTGHNFFQNTHDQTTGTATSATSSTITDTTANASGNGVGNQVFNTTFAPGTAYGIGGTGLQGLATNALQGYFVRISSGTGNNNSPKLISASTTAGQITISGNFETTPDNTSHYVVFTNPGLSKYNDLSAIPWVYPGGLMPISYRPDSTLVLNSTGNAVATIGSMTVGNNLSALNGTITGGTVRSNGAMSCNLAFQPPVFALTDAATIAVNGSFGNVFTVTLGGNRTLANPTALTTGQSLTFVITQDGTGLRTLSYGTLYDWGTVGAPTLSVAAGAVDILPAIYIGGKVMMLPVSLGH